MSEKRMQMLTGDIYCQRCKQMVSIVDGPGDKCVDTSRGIIVRFPKHMLPAATGNKMWEWNAVVVAPESVAQGSLTE